MSCSSQLKIITIFSITGATMWIFQKIFSPCRPPQSAASCRLSARHILKKAIWQAHLSKTTQSWIIYNGRHILLRLRMPGTFSDCRSLPISMDPVKRFLGSVKNEHVVWSQICQGYRCNQLGLRIPNLTITQKNLRVRRGVSQKVFGLRCGEN